ncbi:hypothetical protein QBC43DRAFT_285668 [Cladorrhinum sp. PSN259]|nr:hypothetical protein QBC43DRAFT_285668 [Cladorrhinum sp. PSN259]
MRHSEPSIIPHVLLRRDVPRSSTLKSIPRSPVLVVLLIVYLSASTTTYRPYSLHLASPRWAPRRQTSTLVVPMHMHSDWGWSALVSNDRAVWNGLPACLLGWLFGVIIVSHLFWSPVSVVESALRESGNSQQRFPGRNTKEIVFEVLSD